MNGLILIIGLIVVITMICALVVAFGTAYYIRPKRPGDDR